MSFRMFTGGSFEHTHERKQMDELRKRIQKLYQGSEDWCALFADISIKGRQLDGFILKKDALIILEMKDYHGKIVADLREDRHWIIDPPDGQPFEPETNPFFQVRKQRGIIASTLDFLRKSRGNLFKFISAWVMVQDDAQVTIISNDNINEKWFKVLSPDQMEQEIPFLVSREELHLEDEEFLETLARATNTRERNPDNWFHEGGNCEPALKVTGTGGALRFRALDDMLRTGSPGVICKAKDIIVTLELEQYGEDLLKHREHQDPWVRYHVLDALQYLHFSEDQSPLLLRRLRDKGEQGPGPLGVSSSQDGLHFPLEPKMLKKREKPLIPELAATLLITMGPASVVPELVKIIQDSGASENEVMNTVRVLKEIGDASAVEPIVQLTRNYHERFPDSSRFRPMEDLLAALGETGSSKAVPRLKEVLREQNEEAKLVAIEALGRIGGSEAKRSLLTLLGKGQELDPAIISSLGEIADHDIAPHLYPYLQTQNWYLLARTLEALRNIKLPGSFDTIWKAFLGRVVRGWDGQELLLDVLFQLDPGRLREKLDILTRAEDKDMRARAGFFLQRLS